VSVLHGSRAGPLEPFALVSEQVLEYPREDAVQRQHREYHVPLVRGLGVDDPAWDHPSFTTNRDRLLGGEISAKFLQAVLGQPKVKRVLSSDHFSVDGTLIEAWASIKRFRRKDGQDNDRSGPGRNAERNFHKEKRSNETHQSTADAEARLYKKGDDQPARLCYRGHALMENRHGLAVDGGMSLATGTAERETALQLVVNRAWSKADHAWGRSRLARIRLMTFGSSSPIRAATT
jgi:hypothetical protein